MNLTQAQLNQIRYYVSCNPTILNMERVGRLSDEEILSELESFKETKLEQLYREQEQVNLEINSNTIRLANINKFIELLEGN